jgi:hypothetical protein
LLTAESKRAERHIGAEAQHAGAAELERLLTG